MQKVNYQKMLEGIIKKHEEKGEVPTLLLHSCCAPCSSYVLEYLSQYFKITVFTTIRTFIPVRSTISVWRSFKGLLYKCL